MVIPLRQSMYLTTLQTEFSVTQSTVYGHVINIYVYLIPLTLGAVKCYKDLGNVR